MKFAHDPLPHKFPAYLYGNLPIYKFDRGAGSYCYPAWPSEWNNRKCKPMPGLSPPIFYQNSTCSGQTVYTYWMWFDLQKECTFYAPGSHDNDWEHVFVYMNPGNGQVLKLSITNMVGIFKRYREGEWPIVCVGEIAHGSSHEKCDGKCKTGEFFKKGCLDSVKYCQGGYPYWDDFRNPGPILLSKPLMVLNVEISRYVTLGHAKVHVIEILSTLDDGGTIYKINVQCQEPLVQ